MNDNQNYVGMSRTFIKLKTKFEFYHLPPFLYICVYVIEELNREVISPLLKCKCMCKHSIQNV